MNKLAWRTFPYWLFALMVLTAAITAWRYDILACRPYWGAAMGVFAHAQAVLEPELAKPVVASSPAPAMYSNSFVPYIVAGLQSILPNASSVIIVTRLLNIACAALTLILIVWWLRPRIGWGGATVTAAAILTTPIFLVQVEQLGPSMFLVASLTVATVLLFEGRGILSALFGVLAFFAEWTAVAWLVAALIYLCIQLFRPAAGTQHRYPVVLAIVAHTLAIALAAGLLYFRAVPDLPWGGWVPNERFGTSTINHAWRWIPDLLAVCAVALLLGAWRLQKSAGTDPSKADTQNTDALALDPTGPPLAFVGPFLLVGAIMLATTGATPASFVLFVPFLWMAVGILLLDNRRSNLLGMALCFLVIGFNLYNSTGKFLPPLADAGSRDWRTGSLLQRSREYLADYVATEDAIRASIQLFADSQVKAIAAPTPFIQFLAMPGLGYASPVPLRGYSLGSFSNAQFPPIESQKSEDPGDLAIIFVWNHYTTNNAWDDPRPQRGDIVAYQDPRGEETTPLLLYIARRIPSESQELASRRYARRFWPEHSMITAARGYLQADDPARAEATLRHHLESTPESGTGRYLLGQILEQRGDIRAAIAEYRRVPAGTPEYWQALFQIAVTSVAEGKLDEADSLFQDSVRAYEKQNKSVPRVHAQLYLNWAGVDLSLGNWAEAAEKLQKSIQLDPTFPDAYRDLGFALVAENKLQDALEPLQKAVELDRQDAESYRLLGGAQAGLQRWADARDSFRQALALQPADIESQDSLATALMRLGRYEEALAEYEDALSRLPDGPSQAPVLFGLAKVLKAQGNTEEALTRLRAAVAADPQFFDATNELAWILATSPDDAIRNGGRAVELAETLMVGEGATNPAYLDTLAAAYAEAGQMDRAIETAQKAIDAAQAKEATSLLPEIELRTELFRQGKPYREPPMTSADDDSRKAPMEPE